MEPTKICTKCNLEKPILEFHRDVKRKDGLTYTCKVCNNNIRKNYRENNLEKVKQQEKLLREKSKVERKKYADTYRELNKSKLSKLNKEYRIKNINNLKEKEFRIRQTQSYKDYQNNWKKSKRKSDNVYRLKTNLYSLLNYSFKNNTKKSTLIDILGCTIQEFKEHIESQFQPWMNWSNYGNPKDGILDTNKTWDLDHIIPISSAKTEEELIKLNHYTNFQPLCSYENRCVKKGKL